MTKLLVSSVALVVISLFGVFDSLDGHNLYYRRPVWHQRPVPVFRPRFLYQQSYPYYGYPANRGYPYPYPAVTGNALPVNNQKPAEAGINLR